MESQPLNIAMRRKERRWFSRMWGHPLVVVLIAAALWPCVAELVRNQNRSVVAEKLIALFQSKPPATPTAVPYRMWRAMRDKAHVETFLVWVPVDGPMEVIESEKPEIARALDNYGKGGEIWEVMRTETPGGGHWLIPWNFHSRVKWEVTRYSPVIRFEDPTLKRRVVDCLVAHFGKDHRLAIEIEQCRAGMKEFAWWEFWPLVVNVVLIVLTVALLVWVVRMPFWIAREMRELVLLRRASQGLCMKCCYDISATKATQNIRTCPECGTQNDSTQ